MAAGKTKCKNPDHLLIRANCPPFRGACEGTTTAPVPSAPGNLRFPGGPPRILLGAGGPSSFIPGIQILLPLVGLYWTPARTVWPVEQRCGPGVWWCPGSRHYTYPCGPLRAGRFRLDSAHANNANREPSSISHTFRYRVRRDTRPGKDGSNRIGIHSRLVWVTAAIPRQIT